MPTDNSRNSSPNPRNVAANKLNSNSLKMNRPWLIPFGRDTTKTKNHDVNSVPMTSKTVANSGNAVGLIGDVYRTNESILPNCILMLTSKYEHKSNVIKNHLFG